MEAIIIDYEFPFLYYWEDPYLAHNEYRYCNEWRKSDPFIPGLKRDLDHICVNFINYTLYAPDNSIFLCSCCLDPNKCRPLCDYILHAACYQRNPLGNTWTGKSQDPNTMGTNRLWTAVHPHQEIFNSCTCSNIFPGQFLHKVRYNTFLYKPDRARF